MSTFKLLLIYPVMQLYSIYSAITYPLHYISMILHIECLSEWIVEIPSTLTMRLFDWALEEEEE